MVHEYIKLALTFIDICMYMFLAYCIFFGAPEFFLEMVTK